MRKNTSKRKETVCLTQWENSVQDVKELVPAIQEADIIAAVLPTEMLSDLFQLVKDKMLMQAVSTRRPTGRMTVNTRH